MDAPDTACALGYHQLAGKAEYAAHPMVRAIERLEADHEAVLVVGRAQEQRAREALGNRGRLGADVREHGRLVITEDAHEQRIEHRQRSGAEGHRVEEEVHVGRGIVVAEEAWASPVVSACASCGRCPGQECRSRGRRCDDPCRMEHDRLATAIASSRPAPRGMKAP
jgi:hypothetical protein